MKKMKIWYPPGQVSTRLFWSYPLLKKMGCRIRAGQQLVFTPSHCQGALLAVDGWDMDGSIMLGKVLGHVDRSRLNCARKIQLGYMTQMCLAPHKERTTRCSKRYNEVRYAQVVEQCTSMCGVNTEKGQVISAVLALRAK